MIAFQTAVLAFKIIKSGKPSYIARKLQRQEAGMTLRESQERIFVKNTRLTISREGFIHRAALLLNSLGIELRKEEKINVFKTGLRKWVLDNIPIKPKMKYQKFESRLPPRIVTPAQVQSNTQDIRRFTIDRSRSAGSDPTVLDLLPTPTDRPPPTRRPTAPGSLQGVQDIRTFFQPKNGQDTNNKGGPKLN